MNQISHKLRAMAYSALFVASTVVASSSVSSSDRVSPFLNFRSPGTNVVSKVTATNSHKFLGDMCGFYGLIDLNFSYERSFRPGSIARSLFGPFLVESGMSNGMNNNNNNNNNNHDDNRFIHITGSAVENRAATDLLADYFFLPTDFDGSITFSPRVQNFVLFVEAYFGFDEWAPGLYVDIYGAVVNSRFDLNAEEVNTTQGTTGYEQGYFANVAIEASALNRRALDFLSGKAITLDDLTIQQLNFAKIKDGSDKETAFSELRVELGYNFWLEEDYHFGINLQFGFPTGNKPKAQWLFEAMPSSGKYFKLGGGLTAHYTLWRSDDGDHHLDLALDASATHWFKGKQRRTFDLIGKPLSRYMLAEKMGPITPTGALLAGANADVTAAPTPAFQFIGEYAPVANISTRDVKVSVGAEVDLALWFVYMYQGWEFDLGYNLWYRSSERISLSDDQAAIPANTWALKGDAFVFGSPSETEFAANAVGLSATESGATINSGTSLSVNTADLINVGIDTPALAFTTDELGVPDPLFTGVDFIRVNTSTNPVFITDALLNLDGAETRGFSNKVFAHFSYSWINCENWIPLVGIGFEGEFGRNGGHHHHDNDDNNNNNNNNNNHDHDHSRNVALSKWAVSLKVGVSFE